MSVSSVCLSLSLTVRCKGANATATTSQCLFPCRREDRCCCEASRCDAEHFVPFLQRHATILARCVSAGSVVVGELSEQGVKVRSESGRQLDRHSRDEEQCCALVSTMWQPTSCSFALSPPIRQVHRAWRDHPGAPDVSCLVSR